jgi:hypothetical protein
MIQIIITSPEIKELKGIAKVSQKPYHLRIQTAYAATVNKDTGEVSEIPDKFEVMLDKDQPPYPRGKYQLAPSSLYVSREGRLELAPRLAPLSAPAKA